ncbi:hypothetical protein BJY01DRAFT_245181 [Aspergillus pseudoustus]|uniref:Uncharacterized protein n=1 Tax=Aspergillus pseudoustus TaxID=1810923 RepID=A0ABR4KFM4_9EURO
MKLASIAATTAANKLVPMEPVQAEPIKVFSEIILTANIVHKLVFCSLGQKALGKIININSLGVADTRGLGAIIDAVIVLNSVLVTGWHFFELSQSPGQNRSGKKVVAAITDEVTKIVDYISRLARAIAVKDADEDTKQVAVLVRAITYNVHTGLLLFEAGIGGEAIA